MFGKPFALFKLLGFTVKLDVSWSVVALLIAWSLAQGLFPDLYEGLPTLTYWWMGLAGVIGLFFSLILHELSHSLVARRYGLQIRGITLFLFGGVAEMEGEPASPRAELHMAIAGPLASLGLALGFQVLAWLAAAADLPAALYGVVRYLAFINLALALFNMLPAFPLDGGRVFRAWLWQRGGDLHAATRTAANVGNAVGLGLIFIGIVSAVSGNFVVGLWWFLIGLYIRGAAAASYYQVVAGRTLAGLPVSRFMNERPVTVPAGIDVAALVEDYVYRHHHEFFPVLHDGRLVGSVATRDIKAVPREAWPTTPVGDIAQRCSAENTIEAAADAGQALASMQASGSSRLMVTQAGRLVGILTLKDLLRVLALRLDLEGNV